MTAATAPEGSQPRIVAGIVASAFFMQNLDATVIATALPAMAESFGVAPVRMGVGITAYMLAVAALLPVSGWAADRYGARNIFAAAIAVFTLASCLCAVADSLTAFVAARLLQGAGGAMMLPVGRLVVLRNTSNADLLKAIATITWPGLVAPVIGPPLGGLITTYATWEWIFLLNVPLGAVGLVLVLQFIPGQHAEARKPFDLPGFLLSSGALVCVLYGLESLVHHMGHAPVALAMLAGGAVLGLLSVHHFARAAHPLIDLKPVAVQTFAVAVLATGTMFRLAIGATPFLLPLFFQLGFGFDAFQSGLMLFAYMGGNLLMKTVTTRIIRRFGFRSVLIGNGVVVAASIAALALVAPSTPLALIVPLLFVAGLSRSMQFTGLSTLAFTDVPPESRSAATTLASTSQQIGQTLGIALGALLLAIPQAFNGGAALAAADFRLAFAVTGGIALAACLGFLRLPADAAAEVSGHRPRGGARQP